MSRNNFDVMNSDIENIMHPRDKLINKYYPSKCVVDTLFNSSQAVSTIREGSQNCSITQINQQIQSRMQKYKVEFLFHILGIIKKTIEVKHEDSPKNEKIRILLNCNL